MRGTMDSAPEVTAILGGAAAPAIMIDAMGRSIFLA